LEDGHSVPFDPHAKADSCPCAQRQGMTVRDNFGALNFLRALDNS
jgi:hypothetical protein